MEINSKAMNTNTQKDPGCCAIGSECCNGVAEMGCC